MTTPNPTGTGVFYPIQFLDVGRAQLLKLVTVKDAVEQSIFIILSTSFGERYNNPRFGSNLNSLIFEQNTNLLKDLLYYYTVDALTKWEPRITIKDIGYVYLKSTPQFIGINITYVINATSQTGNYVFPFVLGGESLDSLLSK